MQPGPLPPFSYESYGSEPGPVLTLRLEPLLRYVLPPPGLPRPPGTGSRCGPQFLFDGKAVPSYTRPPFELRLAPLIWGSSAAASFSLPPGAPRHLHHDSFLNSHRRRALSGFEDAAAPCGFCPSSPGTLPEPRPLKPFRSKGNPVAPPAGPREAGPAPGLSSFANADPTVSLPGNLPEPKPPRSNKPKVSSAAQPAPSREAGPAPGELTFCRWSLSLAFRVLRARTPFGAFLASLLHLAPGEAQSPVGSLFPLPWPFFNVFGPCLHLGPRARARVGIRRVVCVVVAALNYMHVGGAPQTRALMQRRPNRAQAKALRYLEALVRSCSSVGTIEVVSATRRTSELVARLGEVTSHVTSLSPSCDPYGPAFPGISMSHAEKEAALSPYRNLDASRIKLSGKGQWDPSPFLDPSLYLAFREPQSLLLPTVPEPGRGDVPLLSAEPEGEVFHLAKRWDENDLLVLTPLGPPKARPYEGVKIFNCLKDARTDRQIADRRGRNWTEGRIPGPSRQIPTGPSLTCLHVTPQSETLSICATDRRDFYHQLKVPFARARRSLLVPPLEADRLRDTKAFQKLLDREPEPPAGSRLFAAFGAILQGDALGVEFASSAHANLLIEAGLLDPSSRVLGAAPFPVGGSSGQLTQGLIIDDFFAISKRSIEADPSDSSACAALRTAKEVYSKHEILGSDDKDVIGAEQATVAGAFLDSSPSTRALGLALVGPSPRKRLALAAVTLELARLGATTDHLHSSLVGGWVSCLLYRRPLMCLFDRAFSFVDFGSMAPTSSKILPLSRKVADELVMISVLSHILVSDISAPWSSTIFATDSSDGKGAFVSAATSPELTERLWTASHGTAESARLLSRERAALQRVDPMSEDLPGPRDASARFALRRPLALQFEFLSVGPDLFDLTGLLADKGFKVGPRLHPPESPEFCLLNPRVWEWVWHLRESGLLDCLSICLPSASFALARKPPVRTRGHPFGSPPLSDRTRADNLFVHRCFSLFWVAVKCRVPVLLDHSPATLLRYLPSWSALRALPGVSEGVVEVKVSNEVISREFLDYGIGLSELGASTMPALLADLFSGLPPARSAALGQYDIACEGLESPLVNDLAVSLPWCEGKCWPWRRPVHINLLETAAVYRLLCHLARTSPGPLRAVSLIDSNVARCAIQKGRSSSHAMARGLRRIASVSLAFGVYLQLPFCPTRLMPADHPTRDKEIPPPGRSFVGPGWTWATLRSALALPKMRRWSANWVRLCLLLAESVAFFRPDRRHNDRSFRAFVPPLLDFDQTLGFPGEGPLFLRLWIFASCGPWAGLRVEGVRGVHVASLGSSHGLRPRNLEDQKRLQRRDGRELPSGRPVEPKTQARREALWQTFLSWLRDEGVDEALVTCTSGWVDVDAINAVLSRYGRALFGSGRPYAHYAETINCLSSKVPKLRRVLQPAWDTAFSWKRAEPGAHHHAMPWQILLGLVALALSWGWPQVAATLALAWGGLLRIGEILQAKRQHLLMPQDIGYTIDYLLFSIEEPKTRHRGARHQSVKVDQPDIIRIVTLGFANLRPHEKLWQASGQTLRVRFRQLCTALGVPASPGPSRPHLELASLRAGGATWMMLVSEDADLVRRRGRWLTHRIMEIYVQEVSALQFYPGLDVATKHNIMLALGAYPHVLEYAEYLHSLGLSTRLWYFWFSAGLQAFRCTNGKHG